MDWTFDMTDHKWSSLLSSKDLASLNPHFKGQQTVKQLNNSNQWFSNSEVFSFKFPKANCMGSETLNHTKVYSRKLTKPHKLFLSQWSNIFCCSIVSFSFSNLQPLRRPSFSHITCQVHQCKAMTYLSSINNLKSCQIEGNSRG